MFIYQKVYKHMLATGTILTVLRMSRGMEKKGGVLTFVLS